MSYRSLRVLAAAALAVCGLVALSARPAHAQAGNAFIVFDYTTGQLRFNPGTIGAVTGYGITAASPLTFNGTAVFPSGSYPFPATNSATTIGAAFYSLTAPNIVPNAGNISTTNLQLNTTGVVASTTPGFVGSPEWVFGNVGPTTLTESQALTALGATTNGGVSTGSRTYTLQGVLGNQQLRVFAVPEPATLVMAGVGVATLGGVAAMRRRRLRPGNGPVEDPSRRRAGIGGPAPEAARRMVSGSAAATPA